MTTTSPDPESATITAAEVAEDLSLRDVQTVYRRLKDGTIPGGFKIGQIWRVHRATYKAWLANQ